MKPSAAILLIVLATLASQPAWAPADLVAEINAIRARGCAGHAGAKSALRPEPRLDRAARALADGRGLREAVTDVGYGAEHSAMFEVAGDSDAAIVRTLARRGCADVVNPAYRDVGVARRGDTAWFVLAAPLAVAADGAVADIGARVLELVNEARAGERRCGRKRFEVAPPLVLSGILQRAALAHARDMAGRSSLTHGGADGSTHAMRATRAGYVWRVVGENIAAGQPTPEKVVAGWLKSPRHCANLMDPEFSEMGVAYAVEPRSDAGIYWVQMFAAPRR